MSAHRLVLLVCLGVLVAADSGLAQPARSPMPEKYKVVLRYSIIAPRDAHVVLYDELIEHLKSLGFEFIPPLETHPNTDREDPSKDRLVGLASSRNLLRLLQNQSVSSLLAMPVDYKVPEDAEQPVRVRLELASRFSPTAQKDLANQTRVLLEGLGFREAPAYDHRGRIGKPQTRLIGTVPAGQLENLLKDLREQPGGWFAPMIALADLPTPVRNVSPILITEVNPDPEPIKDLPAIAPREPGFLNKVSDWLWELAQKKETHDDLIRLQVILAVTPSADDTGWRGLLAQAAPGFLVEGEDGAIITGLARIGHISNLAALPIVMTVREVRPAQPAIRPDLKFPTDNKLVLDKSGLAALHRRGIKGKGIRLAVIDTDFRGWEELVKKGRLPANTRLVDLTTELNPDIYPFPTEGDGDVGHGTRCALAAALSAPEAEFTLIRIQGVAPYELRKVVEYLRGTIQSPHPERRQDELVVTRSVLRRQREELLLDRESILKDFSDRLDLEQNFGFLGPVYGWIFDDRHWLFQRTLWQEKEELELRAREERFIKFHATLASLKGMHIVTSALSWNTDYPQGGGSALARFLDDPRRGPLWFQAAGNTRGQTWNDMYRDVDGNGVMEFANPQTPLPKDRWTRELNFLAWQPYESKAALDLPEKLRLRIALQWQEPHDADYFVRIGTDDYYRRPLAEMKLVLLRQRDPEGKTTSADDFELVARSTGTPQRLENRTGYSVYEQVLEFTIDKAGRYALRLERQLPSQWTLAVDPQSERLIMTRIADLAPSGIRPLGVATLPALEKTWELWPRLFLDAADAQHRRGGRPVFADFETSLGSLGTPADAYGVFSVGAADLMGRRQPYSAGLPADIHLSIRPDVLTYDGLDLDGTGTAYGTCVATPFAAGLAAAVLSSGVPADWFVHGLRSKPGTILRTP